MPSGASFSRATALSRIRSLFVICHAPRYGETCWKVNRLLRRRPLHPMLGTPIFYAYDWCGNRGRARSVPGSPRGPAKVLDLGATLVLVTVALARRHEFTAVFAIITASPDTHLASSTGLLFSRRKHKSDSCLTQEQIGKHVCTFNPLNMCRSDWGLFLLQSFTSCTSRRIRERD